jgi:hypothetical protein|tara:strand:+ start:74 stop:253 length:180 start_codon:yes stop_codon:yes gene_type:complete
MYTKTQKINIVTEGMQRIEDALRDAVECIEDAGELIDASSLKEALTICELMNPKNYEGK